MLFSINSPAIISISGFGGHLQAAKTQVFTASCLRCRPGAAKWRPRGRKMASVGSPGIPKAAKGSPNASQNAPKNHPKSAPLSRSASKGAPRVPRVPHRPQNASIIDVPPTGVTPSRGNVQPSPPALCYTPLMSSTHYEASPERGGLGVSPLG